MQLVEVKDLHARYIQEVTDQLAPKHDASTRSEGIFHFLGILDRTPGVKHVGEFGSGFSTLGLREWRRREDREIQFTTLEHDDKWILFVQQTLRKSGLLDNNILNIEEYRASTLMMSSPPFDAVFIDHGPTMAARWNDVPWILSLVQPGGLVVFDDWWPEHARSFRSTKRIIRILTRMGLCWTVIEKSRHDRDDKAIAVVTMPRRRR